MTGAEQEKLGGRILACAVAVLMGTALAFVWWLALWERDTPHEEVMAMRWPFVGLAISLTLTCIGGPIMLSGQKRKYRERD